jgi:predicted NACHT family NTPase
MDTLVWLAGVVGTSAALGLLAIPKELWRRWREKITNRLERAIDAKISRYHRRYREYILASLRFINSKGLATVGPNTPELDAVFVDVSLDYRAPHQVPETLLADVPAEGMQRHSITDFLDRPEPMVLAVIGGPGSGKTTLLRHTARVVCQEHRARRRPIPILLYLRDHIAEIASSPLVSLPFLVRETLGLRGGNEPETWFDQRLEGGDCVVMLDGLDEVAKYEERRAVADWVERQVSQHPRNDFVITSRPRGYRDTGNDGAIVLQVQGFTPDQVSQFVRNWYTAVDQHSAAERSETSEGGAADDAEDLLDRLSNAPALSALTVNPLLLTMIANVHRYRGALPGSRADLYSEICQVMLWRRQESKRLPSNMNGDRKETLLRALAYNMMADEVQDLAREDVLQQLKRGLNRISTSTTAEGLLDDVSSNGLLVEREADLGRFRRWKHLLRGVR